MKAKAKKTPVQKISNPVAPTTFSAKKMKLVGSSLPLATSPSEDLAEALQIIAQACLEAAAKLQGKPAPPASPSMPRPLPPAATWLTVTELVNEFLLAKARSGRSDRYLRQLRICFKNFAAGRSRHNLDQVKTHDVEKWMLSHEWSPKTCRNYVSDVRTLFNFAIRRGYVDRNPAAGVELPVPSHEETIGVHTPEQVREVLTAARKWDLDVCRHLAVRYFAGVRSAECHRLRESDLKFDQGFIEVPAAKAKTRSRRLVTIQPNLKAWLELGGALRPLSPFTVLKLKHLAKVPWPHNATRHSFVSYHVARFGNAGKTALEAGTSEQMVFKHYRALVTPAAAEEFWSILPK